MVKTRILVVVLAGALLGGCGGNTALLIRPVPAYRELQESVILSDPGWFISDRIAVVDVDGVLMNERDSGLFGSQENPVSLFIEKIDRAQRDTRVRALVVRVNSPGGGVTASDIMYQRLLRFRLARPGVPVIAMIQDLGTSGGYYVACGADTILAHPTSVTGSIGVVVQTYSVAGTLALLRVQTRAITSGPHKDMVSPLKVLDPDDLALVQRMVDEFYGRFVDVVAAARSKLDEASVRTLADGRIYTAQQAMENGLIDGVGYMHDVLALAKRRSGADRVKVVMYDRPVGHRANAYSQAGQLPAQVNLLNVSLPNLMDLQRPQFLYLWAGQGAAQE